MSYNFDDYETIIGLEVHAQLKTKSKMYCRCDADYVNAAPNTHVCPVCLGMPGSLPTVNKQAVEYAMMTALALNCHVAEFTKFDRKNYNYPDLVKGYQISQYDLPIGSHGWLTVDTEEGTRKIGINRCHMEEDVGKLTHHGHGSSAYTTIDFNRAGMPLLEIVSEPDMRSPEEARQYLVKLRSILWYTGVSNASMEEGSFRCDANISIRPKGTDKLLTKVEVKNINSFRGVFRALAYEEIRQREMFAAGERIIQETRGWLDGEGKTISQRSKEEANDYRYFPEPDIPPITPSREWVEEVRAKLPELPDARRDRFMEQYALSSYDSSLLTSTREMADYYEKLVSVLEAPATSKDAANWVLGSVSTILNNETIDIAAFAEKIDVNALSGLITLVANKTITANTGKEVLDEMYKTGKSAKDIVAEKGLAQISDEGALDQAVADAIAANPQAVADYKAGKTQSARFLVGQVMKLTKGRANANLVMDMITKKLGEL